MLHPAHQLQEHRLSTADGSLLPIVDLLFEDDSWSLRYLVVCTSGWIRKRRVLLPIQRVMPPSPHRLGALSTQLERSEVEALPGIDRDPPVGRQRELRWANRRRERCSEPPRIEAPDADAHLRSTREVTGYEVFARDGLVGHLRGFLVDDSGWQVPFMIVETGRWRGTPNAVLATERVQAVHWSRRAVEMVTRRSSIRRIIATPVSPQH